MNKKILIPLAIAAVFLVLGTKKAFANVVKTMRIRTNDAFGSGAFGAARTDHVHQGIDVVASVGETIYTPISGAIIRFPYPYPDDHRFSGIEIKNNQYVVKVFYVSPTVKVGANVSKGQPIGKAQNITSKYGAGMTNHVHIEIRETATGKLLNPTNLF